MHHILQPTDKLTNTRTSRSALSQELTVAFPSFYMLATMALGAVLVERGETQFTNIFTVVMGIFMCAQFVGIRIVYTPSVILVQRAAKNIVGIINLPSEDDAARVIKRRVTTATSPSPTFPSRIPRIRRPHSQGRLLHHPCRQVGCLRGSQWLWQVHHHLSHSTLLSSRHWLHFTRW